MKPYILTFNQIDKTNLMMVGGKGLNLGELSKVHGIKVPDGFCITTEAYRKSIENNQDLKILFEKLTELKADHRDKISEISKKIRLVIESLSMDFDIEKEITRARIYTAGMKLMLYVQALQQRTFPMHPLQASRTLT